MSPSHVTKPLTLLPVREILPHRLDNTTILRDKMHRTLDFPILTIARIAFLAVLASLTFSQPAISQELSFLTQTESDAGPVTTVVIDAEYAQKYGIELPTKFTFQVPQLGDAVASFYPPTTPDDALLRIEFSTPDGHLIEEVFFFPMDLPIVGNEPRMERLTNFLVNGAYSVAIEEFRQHTYLGARQANIGSHDAIEMIGEYLSPELGPMLVHIVGILNPQSSHSIFSVANVVGAQAEISSPDDLATTSGGASVFSFEYLRD